MATRAVHLEIAGSLDGISFLQAFFRFIHHRGPVKEIYRDRGTNFVLAERSWNHALEPAEDS